MLEVWVKYRQDMSAVISKATEHMYSHITEAIITVYFTIIIATNLTSLSITAATTNIILTSGQPQAM